MKSHKLLENLTELPEFAQTAFAAGAMQSVFQSLPWFENYLNTVKSPEAKLQILTAAIDHGSAVLPMQQHDSGGWLTPRAMLGAQNYYSCLFGPAVAGTPSAALFEELFRPINSQRPDILDLHPLDQENPTYQPMLEALRRKGWLVDTYFCFGNWQLDVNGRNYANYFQSLPSKLKNTIKRKKQALMKAGNARLEIISDGADIERLIAAYTTIYNSSWKQPEPYPDFMPGLIRTCAQQGWLRAGLAYVDDTPAAAQIWIVHNKQALIYKLAYDEQFGKLSIGSILTAALMEHVIDVDKVQLVDYLMGDEPYKRDWMSHRKERWGIIAFNPRSLKGLLHAARHFGGKWLKSIRKPAATQDQPATGDKNDD